VTTAPHGAPTDVALLDADRELAQAVPEHERDAAAVAVRLPVRAVEPGPVELEALDLPACTVALLIVEGEVTNDIAVDGHALTEMLTTGDVIAPWEPDLGDLDVRRRIVAKTAVQFAVLHSSFTQAVARWPNVLVTLHRRIAAQDHRVAAQGAICQMPRVEDRIVAMLRHMATRNGERVEGGRALPVPLTHEALGRLVGARRPTVTLALKQLENDGRLQRRPDGTWLLPCSGAD
jgi:hypothetical protein